jgi:hypothetical protein
MAELCIYISNTKKVDWLLGVGSRLHYGNKASLAELLQILMADWLWVLAGLF